MLNWKDIPQRTPDGTYGVDVDWSDLLETIQRYTDNYGLNLCPDFQRGHVWTPEQQVAYVEAKLSGGVPMDVIRLNHPWWMRSFDGEFVCVDGLQRLTAAMQFLRNDLPVFGGYFLRDIGNGRVPRAYGYSFRVLINNLPTRAAVLQWYLELNGGGTPHSPEELARVRDLLSTESA